MSATLKIPPSNSTHSQLILHDVSWEMYEQLLEIFSEYSVVQMSYYKGILELMAPLPEHETYAWTVGRLLTVLSEELGLEIRGLRSTTWRSQSQAVGKEADQCFYIQNESLVRDKLEIDLNVDPPPDLAIEIDVTHSALDKLSIYAGLKVPELWHFRKREFLIYQLTDEGYRESEESLAFPAFPVKEIARFLQLDAQKGENARMREFRKWVRDRV
ncbi:MAG: Uma2 family endonuclease [Cyanobacteriota bacterium]|nr:Uma2 family endonuclease [Cyanobacteriota bacterium]